ncbi:MAG: hypothetical protein US60_C0006G0021 [Microgenomates group bacterium GW2011_GWC1_37_8]|uniref:Uncharacterized protein n=1 Tax=Candidatus Woesebacteria bacterium GW2011_GWB1_38_8 TaxID=1618570 RepID=A0A0G0NGV1_9BACT|nr:MAG: hypothetical protein US60_C0006G0021 [Microgenomates group bacterium GW2011_GWC1_37_8]KKQ85094.1 MAG: hypothetical protein UT08_C0010G0021 [Candidatus Woesebacteria bacterium GW2011_GWB1_38_8]
MIRQVKPVSKNKLGLIAPIILIGLFIVFTLAVAIRVGLASRSFQNRNQQQLTIPRYSSPTPSAEVVGIPPGIGWQYLSSPVYGFQIQYPTGWNFFEYSQEDSGPDISGEYRVSKFKNFPTGSLSQDSSPADLELTLSYFRTSSPLERWIDNYQANWVLSDDEVKSELLNINGRKTIHISRYNNKIAPNYIEENFFFEQPPGVWKLRIAGYKERNEEMVSILETMTQSFESNKNVP